MNKADLIKEINLRIDSFDLDFDKLQELHHSDFKRDDCYILEVNYKLSEGNVSLLINRVTPMSELFVEELKNLFAKNFPYPFGKGI
ncbi:hypothetical protein ABIC45_001055 [Mucilaginibacter rubeus]|uniref:hypothetical protein n=1 Tax=Mucilaginibacter rubeus TaxID=2027860 RepID=UPI0033923313